MAEISAVMGAVAPTVQGKIPKKILDRDPPTMGRHKIARGFLDIFQD
jgi:hypothetical protein